MRKENQVDLNEYPIFSKENLNIVSIWASKVDLEKIPSNYFEENYSEDNDEYFNQFSSDFGFGYYDHDFIENAGKYGDTNEEKLKLASFGKSFFKEASQACDLPNVDNFFIMYDFIYNSDFTGIKESKYYKFIGCFNFDKSA